MFLHPPIITLADPSTVTRSVEDPPEESGPHPNKQDENEETDEFHEMSFGKMKGPPQIYQGGPAKLGNIPVFVETGFVERHTHDGFVDRLFWFVTVVVVTDSP
jgi:hypothetical protein